MGSDARSTGQAASSAAVANSAPPRGEIRFPRPLRMRAGEEPMYVRCMRDRIVRLLQESPRPGRGDAVLAAVLAFTS